MTTLDGPRTLADVPSTASPPNFSPSKGFGKTRLLDVAIIVLLTSTGWLITRIYLTSSLFSWGDHPGQFMRFWYPLTHAIPESGRWLWGISSWNPTWYAGYPEIQFYPPGTTLLGIFLNYLTLGQLTAEQVYNLIPAIAFALPLPTCYLFLRYALAPMGRVPSMLGGITSAFLAISIKPMWGGIDGVVIGLMGERLAFGLAPLVLLSGWWFIARPSLVRMATTSVLLAMLVLLHPFHAPAIVLAIILYAAACLPWSTKPRTSSRLTRIGSLVLWLLAWLLLSVALVAWWIIPLLVHYTPFAASLTRANTDQVISWFKAGELEWLWLADLLGLTLLAEHHRRVTATVAVLALMIPFLLGSILFNTHVLVSRFNITTLDPIRFIAEYYLALILLAGCVIAAVTSRFLWHIPWIAVVCTAIVPITLWPYLAAAWDDLHTHTKVERGSALINMLHNPAFDGYWDALRADPTQGRVFFVSNYLHLTEEDGATIPTTVHSITPYLIGREIVGGTFSHWSPIARWLWVGEPHAKRLPAQVESTNGRQIFGKAWAELSHDEIALNLHRLNVTTIVVEASDQRAIHFFDAGR